MRVLEVTKMTITIDVIKEIETLLNCKLDVEIKCQSIIIQCDNKCRLLSHLLHRTGLDVHCNKHGLFEIDFEKQKISLEDVLRSFEVILIHPEWIVGFVEKYADNEFMIQSTFGKPKIDIEHTETDEIEEMGI